MNFKFFKSDPLSDLKVQKDRAEELFEKTFTQMKSDIFGLKFDKAFFQFQSLLTMSEIRDIVEKSMSAVKSVYDKPVYVFSSLFLIDCYKCLTVKKEIENLIYVTGIENGGKYFITKIMDFKLAKQSSVYAKGDTADMHKVLIQLEETGHKLLGVFHNHPWAGESGTMPSGIDINNQERYEKNKYSAISAVFSADGWVRFFSNKYDFDVQIYGEGVVQHGKKLYHIEFGKNNK